MSSLQLADTQTEINRICSFISRELSQRTKVVIGISGGLDSDVVARLAKRMPSVKKIKLFTVLQDDMDPKHLQNARELAEDLGEVLIELPLDREPFNIIKTLRKSDKNETAYNEEFRLDVMRMKCSLRTCVVSFYQDNGYIVLGTGNRTEYETGFYLPFGDGIAHIKPIGHLYKTQVRQLAHALGTRQTVLNQPASAGFWQGEEDLEDLAWWLFNEKPITCPLNTSDEEDAYVKSIKKQLTTEKVDQILLGIYQQDSVDTIAAQTGVTGDVIIRFKNLIAASAEFKNRGYNKQLPI